MGSCVVLLWVMRGFCSHVFVACCDLMADLCDEFTVIVFG